MQGRWFFNCAIIFSVVALGFMTAVFEPNAKEFLGVIQSDESISSAMAGGRVKRVYVISGDIVQAGDPLAEIEDIELEISINEAEFRLGKLKAQVALNKEMVADSKKSLQANIKLNKLDDPAYMEIEQLEKDLKLRYKQKKSQKLIALNDGIVGEVMVRAGSHVAPYQPIVTIYPPKSRYVKGYLHELGSEKLDIGRTFDVRSLSDPKKVVSAKVTSIGKRLIEFPVRLRRNPTTTSWGREIVIELPVNNDFLLSEKVVIKAPQKSNGIFGVWQSTSQQVTSKKGL